MIALNKKTIVPKELTEKEMIKIEDDILKKYVRKRCSGSWKLESASVDIYSVITDAGIKISSHSFDHPRHAALKLLPNQTGAEIILGKDHLLFQKNEKCLKYDAANRLAYLLTHKKEIEKFEFKKHNLVFYKVSHGRKMRGREEYVDRLARRILMPERLVLACIRCLCCLRDREISLRCCNSCLSFNPCLSDTSRLMCLFCNRKKVTDSTGNNFRNPKLLKASEKESKKYCSILEDTPRKSFINVCNLSNKNRDKHPFFDFVEDKGQIYTRCLPALGLGVKMSELLGVTIEDFKERINDLSDQYCY